ncbi:MAG: hypothetical protein H7A35_11455 [Planctomycetales bacterium]|nr:hypothetical protein [bacterium]UNM07476.1 MAG: hypothetical protein H7A35_11455 [Planctomycetales bacterium]
MSRFLTISSFAIALLLLLASCKKEAEESSEYLDLMASNWGIGIVLDSSRENVEATLGTANFEIAARNKLSTDLIWTPEATDAHALGDSQLRLTFTDDKLTRILCIRRVPESKDEVVYDPPFMVKPAAGCSIGSLKSDFVQKLGPADTERTDTLIWEEQSLDGMRLRITAVFNLDEESGVSICNSIAVQTGKALGESVAEQKKEAPPI